MFARVLSTVAVGVGVALGTIALLAVPGLALGGVLFGAFIGVLAFAVAHESVAGDAASRNRVGRHIGLIAGAATTSGWIVVTGIVLLMGPAAGAVLLVLGLIASAMWWRRRLAGPARGHFRRAGDPRAAHRSASPLGRVVPVQVAPSSPLAPLPWSVPIPGNLSTPQLCLAWQHTYFALLELPPGTPRDEIVRVRQRLLDEIERRDPEGFTRWLDTGARAGSNPGRYLASGR